jgi:hypothetical protein
MDMPRAASSRMMLNSRALRAGWDSAGDGGGSRRGLVAGVSPVRAKASAVRVLPLTAASRRRRIAAHTGDPVSRFWMNRLFRGLPVTAAQLRDDRIIEEAISGRADPLHLAAVFGFGPRSCLRYAQAARDTEQISSRQDFSDGPA